MGVCQSIDEVRTIRRDDNSRGLHADGNDGKDLRAGESYYSDMGEEHEIHGTTLQSPLTTQQQERDREAAWESEQQQRELLAASNFQKADITDTVCSSCAAPVLQKSLRHLHLAPTTSAVAVNPLEAASSNIQQQQQQQLSCGSHFVCVTCWESHRRVSSESEEEATVRNENQQHSSSSSCIFCLVEPVLAAIQKYGFCDVTFAKWLQVIASCTGKKNRLLCAASIIANSVEPAALTTFSAAPKETAAGMIISIASILEDRFPVSRSSSSSSSSTTGGSAGSLLMPPPPYRLSRPVTPLARRTVSPKVVQLWIDARESILNSILEIPSRSLESLTTPITCTSIDNEKKRQLLCHTLTRLYLRTGLSYRALTLAGHPSVDNIIGHQLILRRIAKCASNAGIEALDDSHHSVESIKRSAAGLNHDVLQDYPPFMFQ